MATKDDCRACIDLLKIQGVMRAVCPACRESGSGPCHEHPSPYEHTCDVVTEAIAKHDRSVLFNRLGV